MSRPLRPEVIWVPIVMIAALAIYLPSLGNPLLFDDAYLTSGLFSEYERLALRARMLSYGTFVWLQALAGEGWWKQRLFNVAIHLANVVALFALYREILRHVAAPQESAAPAAAPVAYDRSPALYIAIGFFALNPVAVYAVAYLVQRSILIATFFVIVGFLAFMRAVSRGKPWLHGAALACYVLAILSKEHAVAAPLAAVPLYILAARPGARRIAVLAAAGGVLMAAAGFVLWQRYGAVIGQPFDEYSHVYIAQLKALAPDIEKKAWGLSIENQAWLFFQYGLRWMIPVAGWMSINLRPPFPVAWASFPHAIGVVAYAATIVGGFYLLLRYRDWRALVATSFLVPALLFTTEFLTVWIQDPFVLYRSYLWAIGIPGLVFFMVHGTPGRVLAAIGVVLGALLAWQSIDRMLSLATAESAWTDAINKLPRDPRSVGQWFLYLNRGVAHVDRDEFKAALRDFEVSAALGDKGIGTFNMGAVFLATDNPKQALGAFDRAEKEGYNLYNLPMQRGVALLTMGRVAEAHRQLEIAQAMNPPSPAREIVWLNLARCAVRLGRHEEALAALDRLLAAEPRNNEARYLRAMALVSKGEHARALEHLDRWMAEGENAPGMYARAMAHHGLKHKAEARADIERAMGLGLDNPTVRQWKARIEAMP